MHLNSEWKLAVTLSKNNLAADDCRLQATESVINWCAPYCRFCNIDIHWKWYENLNKALSELQSLFNLQIQNKA